MEGVLYVWKESDKRLGKKLDLNSREFLFLNNTFFWIAFSEKFQMVITFEKGIFGKNSIRNHFNYVKQKEI